MNGHAAAGNQSSDRKTNRPTRWTSVASMVVSTLALAVALDAQAAAQPVDLSRAIIVSAADAAQPAERQAAGMLQEEVAKRTGLKWPEAGKAIQEDVPVVVVASRPRLPAFAERFRDTVADAGGDGSASEGYVLAIDVRTRRAPTVLAIGNDARGTLFAVGRLLRTLRMQAGRAEIDSNTRVATKPKYPIRGHQLGYRDASNAYDAWNVDQYEQYIRDLIVFGTNSIELIPALTPNEPKSPLMPLTPWDMTARLSEVLDRYDMNVWLFLPVSYSEISRPEGKRRALSARDALFRSMKRVDAVFVPGGDPGDTPPAVLMPFLGELARVLKQSHPRAEMWVSHQGLEIPERDAFYRYLKTKQPEWLAGVVYGPWARDTLAHSRAEIPGRYRIRHYPDITHTLRCQFPVPQWDPALSLTLGREPINPRPRQQSHIHNLFAGYTDGAITYSDGVNDTVNKIIWSVKGWDPEFDTRQALVEHGRYFISDELGDEAAKGLLALEDNWRGPLLTNREVEKTLALWEGMERRAPELASGNWHFQQGLFRACYDAYIQRRLIRESRQEAEVYERLREADRLGSEAAIRAAQAALGSSEAGAAAPELRSKLWALGASLYDSIRMQLSVPRFGANREERGAVLDAVDEPLNNRVWLESRFEQLLALADEKAKRAGIREIVGWEDAGPGGFYDDLGNAAKEPHLVRGVWEEDPGFVETAQDEFSVGRYGPGRMSWHTQGQTLYETPLRMRYEGLDADGGYELRVVYAGRFRPVMRLVADGRFEVHGKTAAAEPPRVQKFTIPKEATRDGVLELAWHRMGSARGCQVAEVWLVKR